MVNEHEINLITNWIAEYFQAAGRTNAIVGLSGGIDSAVIAALCTKALGKERVLGVILPIESSVHDGLDAVEVIKSLGIDYVTVNSEPAFQRWYTDLVGSGQVATFLSNGALKENRRMTRANAKARFRMTTLYALAEMGDGLVVGTTNKTESRIGYATKYGDGGVDIEPIMDYYKTEVFELAKFLDVPQVIIDRKPSAGLWEGQTDEDEIGMPYSEIDRVLRYLEGNKGEVRMGGYLEASIDKVRQMIMRNEHKTKMPPHYTRN